MAQPIIIVHSGTNIAQAAARLAFRTAVRYKMQLAEIKTFVVKDLERGRSSIRCDFLSYNYSSCCVFSA